MAPNKKEKIVSIDNYSFGTRNLALLTMNAQQLEQFLSSYKEENGTSFPEHLLREEADKRADQFMSRYTGYVSATPSESAPVQFDVETYTSPLTGCVYIAGREPWQLHHL